MTLSKKEKEAWDSFVTVILGFWGNHMVKNDVELVLGSGEELQQNRLQSVS